MRWPVTRYMKIKSFVRLSNSPLTKQTLFKATLTDLTFIPRRFQNALFHVRATNRLMLLRQLKWLKAVAWQ